MSALTPDGLRRIERLAWTTRIDVLVPAATPETAEALIDATLDHVDRVASRFRADSEVSRLSAAPAGPDGLARAELSPTLADLLAAADRAHRLSGGIVDPCLGAEAVAAGYGTAPGAAPSIDLPRGRAGVRWADVTLEAAEATLTMPASTLLDLGATAKARTADLLAAQLSELAEGAGVLVNLGGDIAVSGAAPADGWAIDLAGAVLGAPGTTIVLADGAIATSSTLLRRWEQHGEARHHILDPRTGLPASGPWTEVSVIAGTCADANTAATCAIALGIDAVAHLSASGLAARLIDVDATVHHLGAWPLPHDRVRPSELPTLAAAGAL